MKSRLIRSLQVVLPLAMICTASNGAQYTVAAAGISNPQAINNLGQVAGQYATNGVWYAAVWSTTQGTTTLKPIDSYYYSYAFGINSLGQVAGYSNGSGAYWANTTASPVAIIPQGSSYTQANGINDNGEVTGYTTMGGKTRAFYWINGTATVLGTLGGATCWACNINNSGMMCGYADSASLDMLPYVWQNNTITQLQRLSGYSKGSADDSNDLGQIVGRCVDTAGRDRACLWNGTTAAPVDLGVLSGDTSSQARGINKLGQAVGLSSGGAVLWQNGVIYNLNNLIPANSGWSLAMAEDINDLGQIVGQGYYGGQERTFVLSPVPEPSSLAVVFCGVTVVGGMMRRTGRRRHSW